MVRKKLESYFYNFSSFFSIAVAIPCFSDYLSAASNFFDHAVKNLSDDEHGIKLSTNAENTFVLLRWLHEKRFPYRKFNLSAVKVVGTNQ